MAIIVFVTIPCRKAQKITKIILKERLCVCVNIINDVVSYFWWQGKIDKAKESLMIIKTSAKMFQQLKKRISELHPYEIPEIISLHIDDLNKKYLGWLLKEVPNTLTGTNGKTCH